MQTFDVLSQGSVSIAVCADAAGASHYDGDAACEVLDCDVHAASCDCFTIGLVPAPRRFRGGTSSWAKPPVPLN